MVWPFVVERFAYKTSYGAGFDGLTATGKKEWLRRCGDNDDNKERDMYSRTDPVVCDLIQNRFDPEGRPYADNCRVAYGIKGLWKITEYDGKETFYDTPISIQQLLNIPQFEITRESIQSLLDEYETIKSTLSHSSSSSISRYVTNIEIGDRRLKLMKKIFNRALQRYPWPRTLHRQPIRDDLNEYTIKQLEDLVNSPDTTFNSWLEKVQNSLMN